MLDIKVDDIVTFKKKHPCGGKEWKVLRTGADYKLECTTCNHQIMITRATLEKSLARKL